MEESERERQRQIRECVERIEAGETPADMMYDGEYPEDVVLDALDIVVSRGSER